MPIPFLPKEVEGAPAPMPAKPAETPGGKPKLPAPPAEVLPPPSPVPEEGPKLMHSQFPARSKVELLRPVPLPPEP
jgi:hypothetical protein